MMFLGSLEVQYQRELPPFSCWPHGRTNWLWMRQASRAFECQLEVPSGNPGQRKACSGAADTKNLSRRQAKKLGMDRRQMLPDALASPE